MTSTVAVDDQRLWHRKMFGWVSNCLPLLVACATFFLIIAGALVTSHDAGLATSDWPLSNGQVFPREREKTLGPPARRLCTFCSDRSRTAGRTYRQANAAAGRLRRSCDTRATVFLHDGQSCRHHVAELGATRGNNRRAGNCACQISLSGSCRDGLFAVDNRRDATAFGHLGQAPAN